MIELIGESLKQWELGRQVKITTERPYNEVHFAQIGDTDAIVVEPQDDIANIPNILLQDARKLVVYAVYSTEASETVQEMAKFNIEQKPKPSDYVYTETEAKTYSKLENEIEKLKKCLIEPSDEIFLKDSKNGNIYKLQVVNGKLTMEGVES